MFTVTPKAKKELDDFFAANSDCGKSIRVYFAPGTCGGPTATMTLDKADAEYDVSEEVDGIVFCMTKPLFAMVGNVTVDVSGTGFVTLPVQIYTYVKKPLQPKVYAMFTLLFLLILVLMIVMNLLQARGMKKRSAAHAASK